MINGREFLLHRRQYEARERVGAFTTSAIEREAVEDLVFEGLEFRVKTEVLAERVLDTDVRVSWTGCAEVPQPHGIRAALRCLTRKWKTFVVPVNGTVTVPATYWRKFPEAGIVYPEKLGGPIRFMELGTPYWEQA